MAEKTVFLQPYGQEIPYLVEQCWFDAEKQAITSPVSAKTAKGCYWAK